MAHDMFQFEHLPIISGASELAWARNPQESIRLWKILKDSKRFHKIQKLLIGSNLCISQTTPKYLSSHELVIPKNQKIPKESSKCSKGATLFSTHFT